MNSLLNVFVVVLTSTYKVKCFTLALTEFAKPDADTIYNKVIMPLMFSPLSTYRSA
jgi:hypothetical protein